MAAGGELDLRQTGDLMRFTIAVNFCGLPALSVPVGHSAQGGVWRGLGVIFCGLPALSVPVGHSGQGGFERGLGSTCAACQRSLCPRGTPRKVRLLGM